MSSLLILVFHQKVLIGKFIIKTITICISDCFKNNNTIFHFNLAQN
jgi:hypothetical protein